MLLWHSICWAATGQRACKATCMSRLAYRACLPVRTGNDCTGQQRSGRAAVHVSNCIAVKLMIMQMD